MDIVGECSREQLQRLYDILPVERKELIDRTKKEAIAKKRIYTGAFLQYVLSKETGIPMRDIRYRYNEWGKPEVDVKDMNCTESGKECTPKVCFNLSHSGKYVVLAICDKPVGVDIEHKTTRYDLLSKRFFCKEEYEDIMSKDTEQDKENCFLEYWTMKEAYIKCLGEGLRIPLNSFRIKRSGDGISYVEDADLWFATFFMKDGYCISLCSSISDAQTAVKRGMNHISGEVLISAC